MENDKSQRVLWIYHWLQNGNPITVDEMSIQFCTATRTIQRDISDIRRFLANQSVMEGWIGYVKYDRKSGSYILEEKID